MAGTTLTVTDAGMVIIPVWEYEELVRDSERLEIARNYVSAEKYASASVIAKILDVELAETKAGEE